MDTVVLSPVTLVIIQLFHNSLIFKRKFKLCNEHKITQCASNQWLLHVHHNYVDIRGCAHAA